MNRLKYRIFWVDDNIENYIDLAVDDEFAVYLQNYGFHPEILKFETAESALEHIKNDKKFDLILSDLNLATGEQGDTLIRKIRDGEIYTEVLFYSAQADFETVAKKLYTDRVSFLSLVGDEGNRLFKERVKHLIFLTISKLQELDNMRGLVMSETSELDVMIEDILIEIMSKDSTLTQELRAYMVEIVKENNNKRQKLFDKIGELTNSQLIKNRILFDANKKSRTLNEFLKKTGLAEIEVSFKDFHQHYEKDVLQTRNDMAHAKSEVIDGVDYLVLARREGDQPIKIDHKICTEIRTNLGKYNEILQKVQSFVID